MTLADSLGRSFNEDGFDLSAAFSGLGGLFGEVAPATLTLDLDAIGSAGDQIDSANPQAVDSAISTVSQNAAAGLGQIPVVGDLVQPLSSALVLAEQVTAGESLAIMSRFRGAVDDEHSGPGLEALSRSITTVLGVSQDPAVQSLTQLAASVLPGNLDLSATGAGLERHLTGARRLIDILAAAMGLVSNVDDLIRSTSLIDGFLDLDVLNENRRRLASWSTSGLAAQISALDPADEIETAAMTRRLEEYVTDLRTVTEAVSHGMAFGEATLSHAQLPRKSECIRLAGDRLLRLDPAPIRQLAEDLRRRAEPLLSLDLGSPAVDLSTFWSEVGAVVDPLVTKVEELDAVELTAPIRNTLGTVHGALEDIHRRVEQVLAALRGAMETVKDLVASLDLERITQAIRQLLEPVARAVAEIDRVLAEAMSALEVAARQAQAAVEAIRTRATDAAGTLRAAFNRVLEIVQGLDIDKLVETLRSALGSVVEELERVQLQPYFKTAEEVIDTTAQIVDAVPLELLPDETERELEEAVAPIKAIDFQADVADVLKAELDAILDTLDEDVLGALQQAYEEVLTFLRGIDPRSHVETLEKDHYDPMVERLAAIDADQLLSPFTDALERFRQILEALDPDDVMRPIEEVFDRILEGFDELDPDIWLEPLERRVDSLRDRMVEAIGLESWNEHLDDLGEKVREGLGKIDLDVVAQRLTVIYAEFLDSLAPPEEGVGVTEPAAGDADPEAPRELVSRSEDGGLIGSLISILAEGDELTSRRSAFIEVRRWLGGADGSSRVSERTGGAGRLLAKIRDTVEAIDPRALAAEAQTFWRSLRDAVANLPAGEVRDELTALLGSSPIDALAPAAAGKIRYLEALGAAIGAVAVLTGSGMSQVNTSTDGLRQALAPLDPIRHRFLALLSRFGVDTSSGDLRRIVHDVLETLEPGLAVEPFRPLLAALVTKVDEALVSGVLDPSKELVSEIQELVATFDLGILRQELGDLHATLRQELVALRPKEILKDLLAALTGLRDRLVDHDPLTPIRATLDASQEAILRILEELRPTVLLGPLLEAYDVVLGLAGELDIENLLRPVLEALHSIEEQLDDGLDISATALGRLQEALP